MALRHNPIILKEFRQRMRGWRGMFNLAFLTLLLSIFGLLVYNTNTSYNYRYYPYTSSSYGIYGVPRSQETGSNYFTSVVIAQLVLACILAPSLCSTSIAGEKERQTYDVLLITLLKPRDIVIGKLFAALAYLLLVIVAGIPVASVAFVMGGVSLDQLVTAFVVMIFASVMLGSIGIFWSSVMRTTRGAGRNTIWNIAALLVGVPLGVILVTSLFTRGYFSLNVSIYDTGRLNDLISWVCSINPIYALLTTFEFMKMRPNSNVLIYRTTGGDWNIAPFVRFLLLSGAVSMAYIWLATRRIGPVLTETNARTTRATGKKKSGKAPVQG